MRQVNVKIEGIVPMLFNRFTEKAQEGLEKRSQGKTKTKEQRIDEAYDKVYCKNGDIGIPTVNIKKSLLDGCSFAGIKIGRRSAMPFMRATVHFLSDFASLGKSEPDGIHECTGNIPPGPKGHKAIIRRPYVDTGWQTEFGLYLVDERITYNMLRQSLDEAGLLIALCDHRPEFGRFIVKEFEIQEK